jgi:peptide/nickel transport system substrate-binding protein
LELNVAKEWEVTDDGKVFTFYLRPGQKWSTGAEFTADDIMFWYEDVLLNEELSPSIPSWWRPGGEPGAVEKIDDYAVRFTFVAPHGILPDLLPFSASFILTYPREYMSQFHIDYADKADLDAIVAERGFEQWFQLFGNRRDWERNEDYPVHGAWAITNGDWTTHEIAERNPYYFKVDPEGNQLPYIDKVVNAITDTEMVPMKIVGGEVDKQAWNTAISNYTLYVENQERGDYQVFIWNYGTSGTSMHINIARHVEEGDEVGQERRELFANRDFRIALSKAIDRDELNTLNYKGLAAPAIELFPESVQQDPEIQELLEYDVDEANRILDELGLDQRDSEGFRLLPSGEKLDILMTGHVAYAVHLDVAEVVSGFWREVGIRGTPDPTPNETWWPRVRSGDVDCVAYEVDYTAVNLFWLTYPRAIFPVSTSTYWGPRYGTYYATDGNEGEAPTPDMAKMQELYDECLSTIDLEQRKALTDEAFYMLAYNLWPIPTVASRPAPCIVKNGFRNVPEYALMAYPVFGERTTKPEQYFWDNL